MANIDFIEDISHDKLSVLSGSTLIKYYNIFITNKEVL